jgi:hypothetical protein
MLGIWGARMAVRGVNGWVAVAVLVVLWLYSGRDRVPKQPCDWPGWRVLVGVYYVGLAVRLGGCSSTLGGRQ